MARTGKQKSAYPQRISLNTTEAARRTLVRFIKLRVNDQLNSLIYRDVLAGLNLLLSHDKQIKECEIEKRIAELEARIEAIP